MLAWDVMSSSVSFFTWSFKDTLDSNAVFREDDESTNFLFKISSSLVDSWEISLFKKWPANKALDCNSNQSGIKSPLEVTIRTSLSTKVREMFKPLWKDRSWDTRCPPLLVPTSNIEALRRLGDRWGEECFLDLSFFLCLFSDTRVTRSITGAERTVQQGSQGCDQARSAPSSFMLSLDKFSQHLSNIGTLLSHDSWKTQKKLIKVKTDREQHKSLIMHTTQIYPALIVKIKLKHFLSKQLSQKPIENIKKFVIVISHLGHKLVKISDRLPCLIKRKFWGILVEKIFSANRLDSYTKEVSLTLFVRNNVRREQDRPILTHQR